MPALSHDFTTLDDSAHRKQNIHQEKMLLYPNRCHSNERQIDTLKKKFYCITSLWKSALYMFKNRVKKFPEFGKWHIDI